MTNAKLIVVKDDNAEAPAPVATVKTDKPTNPGPVPLRRGLHLNVDKVLARSLPDVARKA